MSVSMEYSDAAANTAPLVLNEKLLRRLVWLAGLIEENGTGEYIVTIRSDGAITVKRPRRPLEFHYAG